MAISPLLMVAWLNEMPNPDQSDFGFAEFMSGVDALILGRNSFETVVSFGEWPYPKPVFVLSNSMNSVPEGYSEKVAVINLFGTLEKPLRFQRKETVKLTAEMVVNTCIRDRTTGV